MYHKSLFSSRSSDKSIHTEPTSTAVTESEIVIVLMADSIAVIVGDLQQSAKIEILPLLRR